MEEKSKQNIKNLLLYFGIGAGIVALSLVAPQLPYALLKSYSKNRKFNRQKFNNSLGYLKRKKLIKYQRDKDLVSVQLTSKGKEWNYNYEIDLLQIERPLKWDKRWRMVIFDIPHEKKNTRDTLRRKLNQLGFLQFQKSVFICPYECEKEIRTIANLFEVSEYIKFIVIEKIDEGNLLKKEFNLL